MKPAVARALSTRTLQTYAQDWALFIDWCAAAGYQDLPAEPATVVEFLADCRAAPKTQHGRVAAIDHRHAATGYAAPGSSAPVLAVLGRPTGGTPPAAADTITKVEVALHVIPNHGWTNGMFGRRDRCLLVLSQLAGVPYNELAVLTAGAVTVADGVGHINTAGATTVTLTATDSPVTCPPCAITRWLRVLNVVMTKPSHRVLAQRIQCADPVTDRSPHLCLSNRELSSLALDVPLLPPIDQWGFVPFPLQRLTPHSLSRRVREMLAGDFGAHRHIPINDEEVVEPERPPAMAAARAYTREDAKRAWDRRRAGLEDIADVKTLMAEIDARAKELERRTANVVAQNTHPLDRRNA